MRWLFGFSACVVIVAACGGSTISPGTAPEADAGAPVDSGSQTPIDSGVTPSIDASIMMIDSGPPDAGLPAPAAVQFDNCPAFAACGVDPTGSWDYSGGCFDSSAFTALGNQCQGPEKPTLKSATGTIQGRVIFTATQVTRNVVSTTNAIVTVAKTCFPAQFQTAACATLGQAIALQVPGTTCADGDDAQHCDCSLTITTPLAGTNNYTVVGTQIDVDDGSVYDFCVTGNQLQHQQTTPANGQQPEPGVLTATKE